LVKGIRNFRIAEKLLKRLKATNKQIVQIKGQVLFKGEIIAKMG
jgi:hypothetical protein